MTCRVYDAGFGLLTHEERKELHCQVHEGGEVDVNFGVEGIEVYLGWLREIGDMLGPSIEEDAV